MDPTWGPIAAVAASGMLLFAVADRLIRTGQQRQQEIQAQSDIRQLQERMQGMLPRAEFLRWVRAVHGPGRPIRAALEAFEREIGPTDEA
jgi:hypothetical protein